MSSTDILGEEPMVELATALSVEGIRELQALVGSLQRAAAVPVWSQDAQIGSTDPARANEQGR